MTRSRLRPAVLAAATALLLLAAACAEDDPGPAAGTGSSGSTTGQTGATASTGATQGGGMDASTGSTGGGGGPGRYDYGSGGAQDDGGGGGGEHDAAVTAAGFAFDPTELEVASGTKIFVENADGVGHTFTVDGTDIDLMLDPGDVEDAQIDLDPGSYGFHCRFHSSMTGTLTVT
jgi:plastocyanin